MNATAGCIGRDEYGTSSESAICRSCATAAASPTPQEKVWRALTEDEHLAGWFPTTIEGERVAGRPAALLVPRVRGRALRRRDARLRPAGVHGAALGRRRPALRARRRRSRAACCRLTVTFPEHGKAARDAAGWHVCLEQLGFVCAGEPLPWRPPDRWRAVHPRYVERLGPEASTIGPPEEWERVHARRVTRVTSRDRAETRSGRSSRPRRVKLGRQCASSVVSSMVGKRASSALKAISPSMRAERRADAVVDAPPEAERRVVAAGAGRARRARRSVRGRGWPHLGGRRSGRRGRAARRAGRPARARCAS